MKKYFFAILLATLLPLSAFSATPSSVHDPEKEIKDTLETYVNSWNQGDVKNVISAYSDSDSTIFVSSNIVEGHKNIADFFNKTYKTQAIMGKMAVSNVQVKTISPNFAMAIGKWSITRPEGQNTDGTFTILYEKTNKGWKMLIDHASEQL